MDTHGLAGETGGQVRASLALAALGEPGRGEGALTGWPRGEATPKLSFEGK